MNASRLYVARVYSFVTHEEETLGGWTELDTILNGAHEGRLLLCTDCSAAMRKALDAGTHS